MITLFSEEVETTSTNSVHNTLYVESFEEAFFGVYEFEINNTTVIAEQVGKVDGAPVVRIPVVESNDTKTEVDFILKKGSQLVELGNVKELVTEEVETIIENASDTIKGRNTLYVDSFKETFFGVYEFTFNGKKVVAEKTDELYSHPVVKLPVVESNGSTGEVEFILKVGDKDSNIGDSKAVLLEDSMSLIKEEDLKVRLQQETKTLIEEGDSKNINVSYRIDKEEIIEEIKTDSQAALEKLREETKNIVDDVERIRDSIFIEFASNSDTYRAKESKKLQKFVDKKVEELRQTNKVLAEKVERETRNSLESTYGSFIKKLRESQQELKERKKEHQKIASTLNVLEKTQVELRDEVNVNKREILEATEKSEKSVNKALSRLGTVKKELTDSKAEFDTIKDALAHSIMLAEERVKEYYHNKIEEIENTIFDNVRRDEILKVVKESKAKILTELNDTSDIKEQLRVIATEEYDPITGEEFQRKLKKSIDDKFASEMVNIRRMLESYGGGGGSGWGSEAPDDGQQYVRQNRAWVVSTGGGGGGGDLSGSGTAGTIAIWDGTKVLSDSRITQSGQTVTVLGNIVLGDVSSWQLTVGAEAEFNSQFVVNSNAFMETIIPNDTVTYDLGSGSRYWRNLYLSGDVSGDVTFQDGVTFDGSITGGSATFTTISALTAEFTQTIVSTTSALSVINNGSGPAVYVKQEGAEPIAHFVDADGDDIVFADNGFVGIGTFDPNEKLTVIGNISATGNVTVDGDVNSTNITTLTNNVSALYSYLIENFDHNQITDATDLNDFVTNYPKTGLQPGDVITLSAVNTAYILGNNDGSALTDWFEVNLKPNFLFYKQGLSDYGVLDTLPLSAAKSTKYIIEVEDKSDSALFYGEVNVVSDGTIAVASEYGLNHTTVFPFVEFGAEVISGTHIQLSAIALESKDMANFVFKGNRSNLFG